MGEGSSSRARCRGQHDATSLAEHACAPLHCRRCSMGSCFRFITTAFLAALPVAASAQTASVLPRSWALAQLGDAIGEPPRPAEPDFSKTIEARKSYWIPAAEIFAFDVTSRTIRRNLRSSWVVDRDPFTVNQLGHPYQGSMYHGFARASGLNYWEGLGYTFLGSAFWEVFGETTTPSRPKRVCSRPTKRTMSTPSAGAITSSIPDATTSPWAPSGQAAGESDKVVTWFGSLTTRAQRCRWPARSRGSSAWCRH